MSRSTHAPKFALSRAATLVVAFFATLAVLLAPHAALADQSEPDLKQAQAAIVTDAEGNVLFAKEPDKEMSLASVTKVMTAMVALDSGLDLDAPITTTDVDLGENSQTAGFKNGDQTTLRDLLEVMLVFSGNDAATMVARAVCGDENKFVELMNAKAAQLGMTHTHFTNCHGLEDAGKHYSTVSDMARMGRYALTHYPFICKTVTLPEVTVKVGDNLVTFESTDELVGTYEGMLGIKTGSVESGTTFLGACERNGMRLYTAVLGCEDNDGRFADTRALLDWAYENFTERDLSDSGRVVRFATYAFNPSLKVPVYTTSDAHGVVRKNSDPISYETTMLKSSCLVMGDMPYGHTTWKQGDRSIATGYFATGTPMANVPGYNLFTTLFLVNQAQLQEAIS